MVEHLVRKPVEPTYERSISDSSQVAVSATLPLLTNPLDTASSVLWGGLVVAR